MKPRKTPPTKGLVGVAMHVLFGFFNSIGRCQSSWRGLLRAEIFHAPHTTQSDTTGKHPSSDNLEKGLKSEKPGTGCVSQKTRPQKDGFSARIGSRLRGDLATLGYRTSVALLRVVLRCREKTISPVCPTSDPMSRSEAFAASSPSMGRYVGHLPEERLALAIYNRLAFLRLRGGKNSLPNV
jgi:hypothetical protein